MAGAGGVSGGRWRGARMTRRRLLKGMAGGSAALLVGSGGTSRRPHAFSTQSGATTVAANPHNVLSALVTTEATGAQRVRVEFGADGGFGEQTPAFAVEGAATDVPVLGLRPATDYALRVVAIYADGTETVGESLEFRTGELPASIASFEVVVRGPHEPGYTLLSPAPHFGDWFQPSTVVIVDETGRVVWYRESPTRVADFQMQPNGHFTAGLAQPGPVPLLGVGLYEEWDLLGNQVATWSVQGYEFTDRHEIRLLDGGAEALMFGFVMKRGLNVRALGAPKQGPVFGHVLQRVTRAGQVTFEWNAFDHYNLQDANDPIWRRPADGYYDFTHPNGIEIDSDGHYLISSRSLSEVTKIDSRSGEIIWRMGGGKANEFVFVDDPYNGFSMQHMPRRVGNGNLLILDNGNHHRPPSSRAVEYEVDEAKKTARMVWSFEPGAFAFAMGGLHRMPGGNTLVNLGHDHRVFEVTPDGEVVWELRLPIRGWGATAWRERGLGQVGEGSFGIYRAFRIPSLYGPAAVAGTS